MLAIFPDKVIFISKIPTKHREKLAKLPHQNKLF